MDWTTLRPEAFCECQLIYALETILTLPVSATSASVSRSPCFGAVRTSTSSISCKLLDSVVVTFDHDLEDNHNSLKYLHGKVQCWINGATIVTIYIREFRYVLNIYKIQNLFSIKAHASFSEEDLIVTLSEESTNACREEKTLALQTED